MIASKHKGRVASTGMATRRLQSPAGCVVSAVLVTTAASVVGAAALSAMTLFPSACAHRVADEPMHQAIASAQKAASAKDLSKPTSNIIATPARRESAADDTVAAAHYRQRRSDSHAHGTVLTEIIRRAPTGEIPAPEPPPIPAPAIEPIRPRIAAPPPSEEQRLPPPPQQDGPQRQQDGPAPHQVEPAPQQDGPPPQQEEPPPMPPSRGHVQLAP
jgi:hypothetical protein